MCLINKWIECNLLLLLLLLIMTYSALSFIVKIRRRRRRRHHHQHKHTHTRAHIWLICQPFASLYFPFCFIFFLPKKRPQQKINLQWLCKWIVYIYIVIKEEWCDIVCKNDGKSVLVCDRQNLGKNSVSMRTTCSFHFRTFRKSREKFRLIVYLTFL